MNWDQLRSIIMHNRAYSALVKDDIDADTILRILANDAILEFNKGDLEKTQSLVEKILDEHFHVLCSHYSWDVAEFFNNGVIAKLPFSKKHRFLFDITLAIHAKTEGPDIDLLLDLGLVKHVRRENMKIPSFGQDVPDASHKTKQINYIERLIPAYKAALQASPETALENDPLDLWTNRPDDSDKPLGAMLNEGNPEQIWDFLTTAQASDIGLEFLLMSSP